MTTTRKSAKVIAEVGCNHGGDMDSARKMISVAASYCGVHTVKFQKRNVRELLTEKEYNAPYVGVNSFGPTYGEHREALEFSMPEHYLLKELCHENGVKYGCSVWDMTSAKQIVKLGPDMLKIPSAKNHDVEMMRWILKNYDGCIHVSMGMMTKSERDALRELTHKYPFRIILYVCTSAYPVAFEDVCLGEINLLIGPGGIWSKCSGVGFSGHHKGIAIDMAAADRGVKWIERHFTLDRTQKGTDHAASLEPDGMRRLVRDLDNLAEASGMRDKDILECEIPNRRKLKGE